MFVSKCSELHIELYTVYVSVFITFLEKEDPLFGEIETEMWH